MYIIIYVCVCVVDVFVQRCRVRTMDVRCVLHQVMLSLYSCLLSSSMWDVLFIKSHLPHFFGLKSVFLT